MIGFRCKHPFARLAVEKEQTVMTADEDFEYVDYHLLCRKCGALLNLMHVRTIGGVDSFIARNKAAAR